MNLSVHDAAVTLEQQGLVQRQKRDISKLMIEHVSDILGRPLPVYLVELYGESIQRIGDFRAVLPVPNGRIGWRESEDSVLARLLAVDAVPVFFDGNGNLFGLDLASDDARPAVYFFDHERLYERPVYAAGSSLGAFMLLLSQEDRAIAEDWPADWQKAIDPEIDRCPRAPPLWLVDQR